MGNSQDQYRKDGPDKHPPQDRSEHYDKQNPGSGRNGNFPNDQQNNDGEFVDRDEFDEDFDDDMDDELEDD